MEQDHAPDVEQDCVTTTLSPDLSVVALEVMVVAWEAVAEEDVAAE